MPLNDISTKQTKSTEKTQDAADQIMDYLVTHPDATILYHASYIIRHIHSDAQYLSVSKYRSRLGRIVYCGEKLPQEDNLNVSIPNVAVITNNVVTSSAESAVGACFKNARGGALLGITLIELGHKQPETPLRTENLTDFGIMSKTFKKKWSK